MARRATSVILGVLTLLALALAIANPFGGDAKSRSPVATVATGVREASAEAAPRDIAALAAEPSTTLAVRRSGGCGTAAAAGRFAFETRWEGSVRFAMVQVPSSYESERALPLVLNFHGFGRSAEEQDVYSRLPALAEREGFLLATPQGDGSPPGWDIPGIYNEHGVDDVAFVASLLRELKAAFCIDEDRVFATGLSNGAEMASLAACRLPGVFGAIAPVAGIVFSACEAPGVAVVAFHGTADFNVPFEFAPDSAQQWAAINACASYATEPVSENIVLRSWTECPGREVLLFVVEGGGHTWPGAEDDSGGVGPTTHEIDANEVMWAFFKAHPRQN